MNSRKYLLVGTDYEGFPREVWHRSFDEAKQDGEAMLAETEYPWTDYTISYESRDLKHRKRKAP